MSEQLKVKIQVSKGGVIPSYAKSGDAGLDLTAISVEKVDEKSKFGYIEYGTGLVLEIPEGFVGLLYPRSSISNKGLILSNSVGVIDSGYRGEIKARFKFIKDSEIYNIGDRVAQLIIMPIPNIEFEEVLEVSETERGKTGYGSSDKSK